MDASDNPSSVEGLTEAIREFVRTRHPDRGGDPDEFAAGLAELRGRLARAQAPVVVHGAQRGGRGVFGWLETRRRRKQRPPRVR